MSEATSDAADIDLEVMIDEANAVADPTLCNLRITLAHRVLSQKLQAITGADAGANFHSWAVWGSKKAGVTIRQEDLGEALRNATFVSGGVGLVVGVPAAMATLFFLAVDGGAAQAPLWLLGGVLGALVGAMTGRSIARYSRRRAAQLVLEGNRLVLDDIGRQTARFWSRFHDQRQIADAELEAFLGGMDPRPAEDGGQALLQRAFREYARAANASDPAEKHQAAYFANCLAILNEHVKLQPYIEGSMPFIVRRCVTERMLSFDIGSLTLAVSSDVPPLDGRDFPDTLVELTDASLLDFLNGPKGYDRAKDELVDSAAGDWTSLEDRMAYIVNLFRCFHLDPSVLEPPYEPAAERDIVRGRIPVGAL